MAQPLHIGLQGPFTNVPFGICAIYFDLKVLFWIFNSNRSGKILQTNSQPQFLLKICIHQTFQVPRMKVLTYISFV